MFTNEQLCQSVLKVVLARVMRERPGKVDSTVFINFENISWKLIFFFQDQGYLNVFMDIHQWNNYYADTTSFEIWAKVFGKRNVLTKKFSHCQRPRQMNGLEKSLTGFTHTNCKFSLHRTNRKKKKPFIQTFEKCIVWTYLSIYLFFQSYL